MRKVGIIFFQLLFIMMLFACSTETNLNLVTKDINWIDKDKVTIAWDPVPIMAVDPGNNENNEIRYLVYIASPDTHEEVLADKYVDNIWIDKE